VPLAAGVAGIAGDALIVIIGYRLEAASWATRRESARGRAMIVTGHAGTQGEDLAYWAAACPPRRPAAAGDGAVGSPGSDVGTAS